LTQINEIAGRMIKSMNLEDGALSPMTYASLMVHVDVDAKLGARVGIAADLARRFRAHLIGVAGWAPMSVSPSGRQPNDSVPSDPRLREIKALLDRKGREFQAVVGKLDGHPEWRGELEAPTELLAQEARAADLLIIGNKPDSSDPSRALDPGTVLLKAGRPALVVPDNLRSLSLRRVAIAWKDVREARRAVLDALPFLQEAESVMIVEVVESGHDQTLRGAKDVSAYLARHGIKTIAERFRPAEVTASDSLLRFIEDENIGLIVTGAYGHSRLGEWAFGGVTRDLLAQSPVCCLFSH
jgi:nucleotide-binding universal stress UspA family protein